MDFDLLSSVRHDKDLITASFNTEVEGEPSPILLLRYHYERLLEAARAFDWSRATLALANSDGYERVRQSCLQAVESQSESLLRIRTVINKDGIIKSEALPARQLQTSPTEAATLNPSASATFPGVMLTVYLDTEPTTPSKFTSYKTTSRAPYEAARQRAGITDMRTFRDHEVLLFNGQRDVMEGSIRNVAFWRDGSWATPSLACGCLAGIVRRLLLERGFIREASVSVDAIELGEIVLLFNAGEGCLFGRITRVFGT